MKFGKFAGSKANLILIVVLITIGGWLIGKSLS